MAFAFVRCVVAGLLFFATARNSYDYYTILRWVVCGFSAYAAYRKFEESNVGWGWIFAVIAVTFNPVVPVHLSRETWQPIDLTSGGIMVVSAVRDVFRRPSR